MMSILWLDVCFLAVLFVSGLVARCEGQLVDAGIGESAQLETCYDDESCSVEDGQSFVLLQQSLQLQPHQRMLSTAVRKRAPRLQTVRQEGGSKWAKDKPMPDHLVRESSFYSCSVQDPDSEEWQPAFAYQSVPRGGKKKEGYIVWDGADTADAFDLSMSWCSFAYATDVWINVTYMSEEPVRQIHASNVKIRPSRLDGLVKKKVLGPRSVGIFIPYAAKGHRLSVEFTQDLISVYNTMQGPSGFPTLEAGNGHYKVHRMPRNAMMVFANPLLTSDEEKRYIPDESGDNIFYPKPGEVNFADVDKEIIFFRPGVYYMAANYWGHLSTKTRWIYIAPGAFVKGAFEFQGAPINFKVTGYGVLSGEKYVYEPDRKNGLKHSVGEHCWGSCIKMLQFWSSSDQQHLDLYGVTVTDPPYHTFVAYGNDRTFSMEVSQYKQVGAWYWQTDGVELFTNSSMDASFFHANDDVIKLYWSNVTIKDIVVWKGENGPVIQFGWKPRRLENILCQGVDVIHSSIWWKDKKDNSCIINGATAIEAIKAGDITPETKIKNVLIQDVSVEGLASCALRWFVMSNVESFVINNLKIEQWNHLPNIAPFFWPTSDMKPAKLPEGTKVTVQPGAVKLNCYRVEDQVITLESDTWRKHQIGRLDFDPIYDGGWTASCDEE
eukprot:TRINITY_DN22358_c0_g1_i1.p1 TRINITY_DN22358_c0_g1~~TRINITY_DN22358_c0_g1_i1.p1  ORF type:complete len:663 (-),score=94.31 TRINITY_DN22358_c0_g1_i1:358-2346(-)